MKRIRILAVVITIMICANCIAACSADGKSKATKASVEKPICEDWIHPDSIAYQQLGRKLSDILINAQKIKVYSLVPKEKTTPDDIEIDAHFVRDSLLGVLTKEQATVIKYALVSCGANYHIDTTFIPMSPYCPIIEFEFSKKKEKAHIIISMSDFKWAIRYDDRILFKYNYADGLILHRFCNYFLNKQ